MSVPHEMAKVGCVYPEYESPDAIIGRCWLACRAQSRSDADAWRMRASALVREAQNRGPLTLADWAGILADLEGQAHVQVCPGRPFTPAPTTTTTTTTSTTTATPSFLDRGVL